MSLWRHVARGLRALTRRAAADRDIADEVHDYIERTTEELVARGLSPAAARRTARLELGDAAALREEVGAYGWENIAGTLVADLRYGARRLRRNPGFAAVSILTLALGIGASTAIFSAVNPILFEPLPYPDSSRIATIWDYTADGAPLHVTFGTYRELIERSRSLATAAVLRAWQPTITGAAEPERLEGQRVSASYFRVLATPPARGRDFAASDDRPESGRVAILGDGLWHRRFGGDPAIVGREVTLNGIGYTVVGVMPRGFENVLAPAAEIWTPLQYDMSLDQAWGHHLRMVGRLRPGIDIAAAARELDAIAAAPRPEFPRAAWAALSGGLIVRSLQDDVTRGVKPALIAVLAAVLLVLAIASVNVTNLLLARGAQRRGEFAVRAALGAGRTRMIRQLLTESLLLATLGGMVGMLVAELGVRALVVLSPPGLPRAGAITLDGSVFLFGLAITTAIGLAVGLMPAVHASRGDLQGGLQQSARRAAGGHRRTRTTLVVAEVALALVLLVTAGLLLRSLQRVFAIAPGFDAAGLLTLQAQTAGPRFADDAVTFRFFADALERVRAVPGVTSAAFTSQLPLSGDNDLYGVHFETGGNPDARPESDHGALRYAVSPGYFETLGIPLRAGRFLDAHDTRGAPAVALINESFARRQFGAASAIGRRLRVGADDGPWTTIVGVVGDVKQSSLALGQPDAVYVESTQGRFADRAMSLVVRAHGDPAALAAPVKQAIWTVDKDQPIVRVATMDGLLAASSAERRFVLLLFETFGLVALVLAGTGIYGLLSGSVTERTREIGVRSALGASRRAIVALIVREGMALTGLGVAIGVAGAVAVTRAISGMLFGVSRLDPITYLGVVALMAGASAIACGLPAWRAARVDPASTLRAE